MSGSGPGRQRYECTGQVSVVSWWFLAAAVLPFVVGNAGRLWPLSWIPLLAATAVSYFGSLGWAAWIVIRRTRRSAVVATREGIFVNGRLLRRADQIPPIRSELTGKQLLVLRRFPGVSIEVATAADFEGIRDALGVPAEARPGSRFLVSMTDTDLLAMAMVTGTSVFAWMLLIVYRPTSIPLPGTMHLLKQAWVFAIPMVLLFAFSLCRPWAVAELGTDGLWLAPGLLWKVLGKRGRFVPYATISRIAGGAVEQTLELHDGECIKMRFTSRARARAAREAIMAAAASAGATAVGAPLTLLDRDSSHEDWVRSLRALGEGAADRYRAAAVTAQALSAVVRDPAAPAAKRLGAAIALRAATDANQTLRVAATQTADAEVAKRLVRIADGATDAELALALEEAEALDAARVRA